MMLAGDFCFYLMKFMNWGRSSRLGDAIIADTGDTTAAPAAAIAAFLINSLLSILYNICLVVFSVRASTPPYFWSSKMMRQPSR